jgi:hypothetical protein
VGVAREIGEHRLEPRLRRPLYQVLNSFSA